MSGLHTSETVALALEARLAGITRAAGAETDIGKSRFRGRVDVADSDVPCLVVIEGEDKVDSSRGSEVKLVQRYALVGYDKCDPAHPNDAAHRMLRDIKKAVFDLRADWGKQVKTVEYVGRAIGKRADSVPIVMAVVEIDITFVEDLASP